MNPVNQNENPQEQQGYYYAPLTEGGTFQKLGEETSRMALAAGLMYFGGSTPERATNTAMGGLGNVVAGMGGNLGQLVDNISTIHQNLDTLMTQLNDPQTWMSPTPFD